MLRKLAKAALPILAAAMIIAGCDEEVLPTGNLKPGPGAPSGVSGTFPTFDINNMPTTKYWNDVGHYENLPDLFTFADGRKVTTLEDWFGEKGRRWEIEQIVQHYEYGYMPDYSAANLTITYEQKSDTQVVIHFSYKGSTAELTVNAAFPTNAAAMPAGGWPALIGVGETAGAWDDARNRKTAGDGGSYTGYAHLTLDIGSLMPEGSGQTYGGVVDTLYGYNHVNDLDAPGVCMAAAWGAGRIIDILEMTDPGPAFGGKIDPTKLMITGMSRWGKEAMVAGAFAKSRKGTQIAVTDIGSAGCGGPAMERFISPLGLHEEYSKTVTQKPLNLYGKVYYMIHTASDETNPLVAASSQDVSFFASNHDDINQPVYDGKLFSQSDRPTVVRAVLPDDPSYEVKDGFRYEWWPYEGIYNGNYWCGQEKLAELKTSSGAQYWFGTRLRGFEDKHFGLNCDAVGNLPLRTPWGFLCGIPFDAHFVMALFAGRPVIIHDGYRTVRNNPEGCYLTQLAIDEVYKFLEDVAPGTYKAMTAHGGADMSDFNALRLYFITHSQPEYEMQDVVDLADVWFGYKQKTDASVHDISRFRQEAYPLRDPRSKHDYSKLNWARPGATPLSELIADVEEYNYAREEAWTLGEDAGELASGKQYGN